MLPIRLARDLANHHRWAGAEPFHPYLGRCKGEASCPLNQLRVNKLVMYAPADRWPGLASRYRPILIRTPSIVLVTSSFSALHQLCRVFQAKLIDPNPRRETDEQDGRVVRVLCAATPHDSSLDDKDFYSFVTLLDHGATIYMLGDPDDDFDPGASRIAEKNWIPEVNCVNYLMTIYHNTVYHGAISTSTRSSNSSPRSSTSTTPSPNVLRTRADYLKLPEIHGELDDERWSSSGRRRRNTSVARRRSERVDGVVTGFVILLARTLIREVCGMGWVLCIVSRRRRLQLL